MRAEESRPVAGAAVEVVAPGNASTNNKYSPHTGYCKELDLRPLEAAVMGRNPHGRGEWIDFQCPAHDDDRSATYSIVGGNWFCRVPSCAAKGGPFDLAQRLGVPMVASPNGRSDGNHIVATFDYRDEASQVLFQTVRFDPKDFKQRQPDGRGGFIWNLKGVRRILYRLPELLTAEPEAPVFVPEGEQAVENCRRRGLVATCNPMGAGTGKWLDDFSDVLQGRDVVLLPDNDQDGRLHALAIAESLKGKARSVKTVDLGRMLDLPPRGDVSEAFGMGLEADQLIAWATAPESPQSPAESPATPRYVRHHAKEAIPAQQPLPQRIDGYVGEATVTALVGPAGAGKTILSLDMAIKLAADMGYFGRTTKPCPVLMLDQESGIPRHNLRLHSLFNGLRMTEAPDVECISMAGFDFRNPADVAEVEANILDMAAGLVILDSQMDFLWGADENSAADMTLLYQTIRGLASRTGASFWVIHHFNRAGKFRGSSAIVGQVDTMIEVEPAERDPNNPYVTTVHIKSAKCRDSEPFEFSLQITFGIFDIKVSAVEAVKRRAKILSQSERYVLAYIDEHHQATVGQLMGAADKCSPAAARAAVYRLTDAGLLRRCNEGGRGAEAEYERVEKTEGDTDAEISF